MVPRLPFNPSNVKDCQVFKGIKRAVGVYFTDGTSHIFDDAEVTDELWAFAASKLTESVNSDLRRGFSKELNPAILTTVRSIWPQEQLEFSRRRN
jgi:hypothetical protein